jgi:putrescine aminotransferase
MNVTDADARRAAHIATYRGHINFTTAMLADVNGAGVETRADGCYVDDQDGRRYLDCGGYGVLLLGHRHPRVCAAVKAQLDRQPIGTRFLLNPAVAEAAEAIVRVAPAGLEYVTLLNSGADAVELAFKLSRLAGKDHVVALHGGFHGKTLGALTLTAHHHYREPFKPLVPGVSHVPFGELEPLAAVLAEAPGRCCVFMEPVQAEAGVRIPPPGYLRGVGDLCRQHGQWLILDEIQTGLARTGWWWAANREDVTPDLLLAGKVLSGGVVPVGAVIASPEAWEPLNRDPFLHSATFANLPLAAAAATATIATIESEGLVERARQLGSTLRDGLAQVVEEYRDEVVTDLRAAGLLLGIELHESHLTGELIYELFQRGVIVNHSLGSARTLRLTPSSYMTPDDVSWLCGAFAESLEVVAASRYQLQESCP